MENMNQLSNQDEQAALDGGKQPVVSSSFLESDRRLTDTVTNSMDELKVQFEFLHNNINVIQDVLHKSDGAVTLEIPANVQRQTVQDILQANKTLNAQRMAVNIVSKELDKFNEDEDWLEKKLSNIERSIINTTKNLKNLQESVITYPRSTNR